MKKQYISLLIIIIFLLVNLPSAAAIKTVDFNKEKYLIEDSQKFNNINSPTVAVALSGGGARALVNIGVLKALVEERIPIDLIVGTSMGSIIGTMYGSGLSITQIERIASRNSFAKLFDLNFTSNKSLLKTAQVNKFIGKIVPHKRLEDFPIPTALLSFDLTSGHKYLTTTGNVSNVIQSSYAIPYYFPPYEQNDHYLIDPGLVEMSPAKSSKVLGADLTIATTAFDELPYKQYNTPSRTVGRFINLIQQQNAQKILNSYADIIIDNDVTRYSFMDFTRAQELIKIGYKTTMAKIPTIKTRLKEENIALNNRKERKEIDLTTEFALLRNDRLINDSLVLNPIFHTGKETNFLTHNILTTYYKQAEYGLQLEDGNLETKILTTNNSAQDIDIQLRWKQLSPKTDLFFKSKLEANNSSYSDFKTEIKYYHNYNRYSLGLGNIDDTSFIYTGGASEIKTKHGQTKAKLDLVFSENNELKTLFSQESSYKLSDIWEVKPKLSFNNTNIIPSPTIYRGNNSNQNAKLHAGIDFTYTHNFIDPIELSVLQLTDIRFYTFIDYKDAFNGSYAYGLGNKTNFNLLGLKPIDLETYVAYDRQSEEVKTLIKLDYQF